MTLRNLRAAAAALLLAHAMPALAIQGFSLEAGRGSERTESWRAGLIWKWDKRWFARRAWHLGAYWELQLGQWKGPISSVTDVSLTPVFRLEPSAPGAVAPYVEAAIGFHLLSEYEISRRRSFGSKFQFGDHIGAGVRFGARLGHDVGLRLQHLSNAGLREPNPGINFLQLRYLYHFE